MARCRRAKPCPILLIFIFLRQRCGMATFILVVAMETSMLCRQLPAHCNGNLRLEMSFMHHLLFPMAHCSSEVGTVTFMRLTQRMAKRSGGSRQAMIRTLIIRLAFNLQP